MHGLDEPEVGQETGNETHPKGPNPELAIRLDSPLRKEKTRDKTHLPNTQLINLIRIQEDTPRRASPAPQRGLYSGKSSCVGKWRGLDAKIFRKVEIPIPSAVALVINSLLGSTCTQQTNSDITFIMEIRNIAITY